MFDVGRSSFQPTLLYMDNVHKLVLRLVAGSAVRITPPTLEKTMRATHGMTRHQVKAVIRDLVSDGELVYTYEFGSSFLEISFNKPVRVSTHVVLKPPGHHFQPQSEDVVIQIKPGAAFGDGRHPTSRLAIRGIEHALKDFKPGRPENQTSVLDIGAGSGVLVIAAVRMGIHKGLGIDIDPSARSEAKENVLINRLGDQIEISDQSLETIDGRFDLVTANLRYPTLKKICPFLRKITHPNGFIVFSGIRRHELPGLIKAYARENFKVLWKDVELDWAGMVLSHFP
jgi:ribosomal protein L11 methylase PrmA